MPLESDDALWEAIFSRDRGVLIPLREEALSQLQDVSIYCRRCHHDYAFVVDSDCQ